MSGFSKVKTVPKCVKYFRTVVSQASKLEKAKVVKQLALDENVASALENKQYHPKKHPGLSRKTVDELPLALVEAMEVLTEGRKKLDIVKESKTLRNQLWGRHLPPENIDYVEKMKLERMRAQAALAELHEEIEDKQAHKIEEKLVTRRLQDLIHPWHPLGITPEICLLYFISRTSSEYCVLSKIFSDIQRVDPNFSPSTFFDFGSGIASGYWAVKGVWKEPLQEIYNVDSNANMNELASKILELAKEPFSAEKGVYFRQFLPVSPERTYDIVLSAFSLLELSSFKERMEIIALLWSKTNKYFIIVEDGTNAGYKAVMEARNLITHLETIDDNSSDIVGAHVKAPCPHEFLCPRFTQDDSPCNFKITYLPPRFLESKQTRREHLYSYVVFEKGPRPKDDPQWPRCVRETLQRSKQVQLRLCTSSGELDEVVLIKQHNCSNAYKCAKKTNWGDRLPGKIVDKIKER